MNVLVTGGAGFIGLHTVHHLAEAGHQVLVFDRNTPAAWDGAFIRGDLISLEDVRSAVRGTDAICHIGAIGDVYASFADPPLACAVNVVGTANVLEAARLEGTGRIVHASTWEVYGHPVYQPIDEDHPCSPDHPYNITKCAADQLCRSYRELKDLDVVVLRLGTAYGPGMRETAVLPAFIRRALSGGPITLQGGGRQFRQFTHVRDIARAFLLALERTPARPVLNIVSAERTTIADVAGLVASEIPASIQHTPVRVGDVPPAEVSSEAAKTDLGWEASIPFKKGALELINEYRSGKAGAAG